MNKEFNKSTNTNIHDNNKNLYQNSILNNLSIKNSTNAYSKISASINSNQDNQNYIPKNTNKQTNHNIHNNASINSQTYEYYKEVDTHLKKEQMKFPYNSELTKKAILASLNNQDKTIILQKMIMESQSETIESIVKELKGEFRKIISDKNGNYFCSDLFKHCERKDRIKILEELSPYLAEDSVNKYATRPIQTLVDCSENEEEYKLILYSFNDYNKLRFASLDPYGNFVIQKIITKIPELFRKEFNFIFTSFIGLASKRKYGIITVEKFLDYTKDKDIINRILNIIKNDFMIFAEDQFGNYLIQYILEKWTNLPEGKEIKELVLQNFKVMCEMKYSSFICELFVKLLSEEEKKVLIKTLDLDEFKNTDNQHVIKITNLLGIYKMTNNNINNFPYQMPLFPNPNNFNFVNNINNNDIPMNIYNKTFQNPMNFENNYNYSTKYWKKK